MDKVPREREALIQALEEINQEEAEFACFSWEDVEAKTGLKRRTLSRLIEAGKFPRGRILTQRGRRWPRRYWTLDEIRSFDHE